MHTHTHLISTNCDGTAYITREHVSGAEMKARSLTRGVFLCSRQLLSLTHRPNIQVIFFRLFLGVARRQRVPLLVYCHQPLERCSLKSCFDFYVASISPEA